MAPSEMTCVSALHSQIATLFLVPQEVLLLRHRVFLEYAKISVGPDFIHTLPSFLILIATIIVLWKYPPSFKKLSDLIGISFVYRSFQISVSWLVVNVFLWLWLILQRIVYCSVWRYRNYESEHQIISYPWWQRVWSLYYPVQPPLMSASFISWVITMSISIIVLACASHINRVQTLIEALSKPRRIFTIANSYMDYLWNRMRHMLVKSKTNATRDDSETCSVCEENQSEALVDVDIAAQGDIHPISYGTNWMPQPNSSTFRGSQRKFNNSQKSNNSPLSRIKYQHDYATLIPNNFNEKSGFGEYI